MAWRGLPKQHWEAIRRHLPQPQASPQGGRPRGRAGTGVPQSLSEHPSAECGDPPCLRRSAADRRGLCDAGGAGSSGHATRLYGVCCTEAPRGILYHRYRVDEHGVILDGKIVPPTSQNQKSIEDDRWRFVPDRLHLPHAALTWQCEQVIRNYDPCISCATHFLRLELQRA
jgi:hypothetical protein